MPCSYFHLQSIQHLIFEESVSLMAEDLKSTGTFTFVMSASVRNLPLDTL